MEIETMQYLHQPGGSCACVAWSGVFKIHGVNLSESDVFGLGSGIYFGYCAVGSTKLFDVSLTSSSIVNDLFLNTGVYGKLFQVSNGHKCLDLIFESIDRGFPVAIELNPYYCDGLMDLTPSDLHQFLPAHWVVATDYNIVKGTIIIYDNRQFNPIEISIDRFIKGRETGLFDQNPRNSFFNIFFFDKLYPLDVSIQLSLRKASLNFLGVEKILSFYTGEYGFDKCERQIKLWDSFFKDEIQLKQLLQKIRISITGAGGVKGGYRYLFSRYLLRASDVLENSRFVDISDIFKESAEYWTKFSDKLNEYSIDTRHNYWGTSSELSLLIRKIKELEIKGFTEISKIIN